MEDNNLPAISKTANVPMVNGVLVPNDLDGLWRLTSIICKTKIAGDYKGKPEEAFVAIQLGMSVGLNYMQALQSVAVINNKPSLYGDSTTAICVSTGELEEHDEFWEEGDKRLEDYEGPSDLSQWPHGVKAVVMMKRKGVKQSKISKFSVGDAIRMGKWNKFTENGNKSVWQKHPKDMLMWRARHKTQSVVFADALRGFAPAAITADYDAVDLEPTTSGSYEAPAEKANIPSPEKANSDTTASEVKLEKQQVAEEMKFIISLAQDNNLSVSRLEEFVGIISKENNTTMAGLIPDIRSRTDEFVSMFKQWDETTGSYVGQPDSVSVSESSESEPQTDLTSTEETQPEEDPDNDPEALRGILDLALSKYVDDVPDAYFDSDTDANMTAYISYCAEITERTEIQILQLAKQNPGNYCEYFFKWLEDNEAKEEGSTTEVEDTKPADKEEAPNGTFANAEEEAAAQESETPLVKETPKKSYTPFVKEFKNMPAARFKKWVDENKDHISEASALDFKEAVRKWEKLRGEGKLKGEWPYPIVQANMNFEAGTTGALNARQRVANLKQTNPFECEKARKKLGFATTVSEEAAVIWENMIHEFIEAAAKKAARRKK